jgi:ferric-dicitrate binding protein FerR (iron transport regulator)
MNRKTKKYSLSRIENHQFVSWKEGIITFRNTRLEDLAKMLERTYNVKIVFGDERTKEMRYSGTMLRYKPIDQILDILEMTSEARFEIETRTNEPSLITVK